MAHLYEKIGIGYGDFRRPDPRLRAPIMVALGDAATVLTVHHWPDRDPVLAGRRLLP